MGCTKELSAWPATLVITHSDEAFLWEPRWQASTGVGSLDLTADVRNLVLGSGAAVSLKPAVQLAQVRTDRPDAGAAITAGSVITESGATHFRETLSAASR